MCINENRICFVVQFKSLIAKIDFIQNYVMQYLKKQNKRKNSSFLLTLSYNKHCIGLVAPIVELSSFSMSYVLFSVFFHIFVSRLILKLLIPETRKTSFKRVCGNY